MAATFFLPFLFMAAMTTCQTPAYVYPSNTVHYVEAPTYVMCSEDCPGPTPKVLLPVQSKPPESQPKLSIKPQPAGQAATAFRIDKEQAKAKPPIRVTLYFPYNKSELQECDKVKLEEINKAASEPGAKVTITGYTDKKGGKRYNDRLALSRAKAVKDFLGLGKDVILAGKGKCCYLSKSSDAKNRRAEVLIERAPQKVQKATSIDVKPKQSQQIDANMSNDKSLEEQWNEAVAFQTPSGATLLTYDRRFPFEGDITHLQDFNRLLAGEEIKPLSLAGIDPLGQLGRNRSIHLFGDVRLH